MFTDMMEMNMAEVINKHEMLMDELQKAIESISQAFVAEKKILDGLDDLQEKLSTASTTLQRMRIVADSLKHDDDLQRRKDLCFK